MCETRDDHDWGGWLIRSTGRDPINGSFVKMERTCRKCGRKDGATEFGMKIPSFDKGYKVEERAK